MGTAPRTGAARAGNPLSPAPGTTVRLETAYEPRAAGWTTITTSTGTSSSHPTRPPQRLGAWVPAPAGGGPAPAAPARARPGRPRAAPGVAAGPPPAGPAQPPRPAAPARVGCS